MKVLLIIPVCQRRENIADLIGSLARAYPETDRLIVNDGAEKSVRQTAEKLGCACVDMPIKLGEARRTQRGLKYRHDNGYNSAVLVPEDGIWRTEGIQLLIDAIKSEGADVVIGSRISEKGVDKKAKTAGSWLVRAADYITADKLKIKDVYSSFRAYSSKAMAMLRDNSRFSLGPATVNYLAKSGLKVTECAVPYTAVEKEKKKAKSYFKELGVSLWNTAKILAYGLRTAPWEKLPWALVVLAVGILSYAGFLAYRAGRWYVKEFGRVGFTSILSTLGAGLKGTPFREIVRFVAGVIRPSLLIFAAIVWVLQKLLAKLGEKNKVFLRVKKFSLLAVLAVSATLAVKAGEEVELWEYLEYTNSNSTLYEDHYIDPRDVQITFPEEKRNLVYIFLESMETTYTRWEKGGQLDYDVTSNLYNMRLENINFSTDSGVGGFPATTGATWTIGALTAQTSGVPLTVLTGYGRNKLGNLPEFLPGLYTMNSVLADNGYFQSFMCGSDAAYGGRDKYFVQHGVNRIYDLFTAYEDGIVPQDYYVWWGYEDHYLYDYAKAELSEISQQEEPFAFFLLTVDTHRKEGYLCELCGDEYEEQYENVLDHADRMIAEFMDWLIQQDFYENTTVIIAGDHLCMEMPYFDKIPNDSDRRVYNTFINSVVTTENTKNRQFVTMDMFPTVLAAMGAEIEGDRLGLGTNLFSDLPTLREIYGTDKFNLMLMGGRKYYTKNFYQID